MFYFKVYVIFQADVISFVISTMKTSKDEDILMYALRTVGNITGGTVNQQTDTQTDTLLEMGLLNTFSRLLRHSKSEIVEVS